MTNLMRPVDRAAHRRYEVRVILRSSVRGNQLQLREKNVKNFFRSFKTTLAGSVFGGGLTGQALYNWLNGGPLNTHELFGGLAIMALGLLAKDADKAGTAGPTN